MLKIFDAFRSPTSLMSREAKAKLRFDIHKKIKIINKDV